MKVTFSYGLTNDPSKISQNIYIRVRHGKNVKLNTLEARRSTQIEVEAWQWDFANKRLRENPEKGFWSFEQQTKIVDVKRKIRDIEDAFTIEFSKLKSSNKLRTMTTPMWIEWCDATLKTGQGIIDEKPEAPFFLNKFREYIDFKRDEWKPNTLRNNESSYRMLSAFMDYEKFVSTCSKEEDRDLTKWSKWYSDKYGRSKSRQYRTNEIDLKFYRNLREWHTKRGNQLSGAFSDQIKHIKKVLAHFKSEDKIEVHHNIEHKSFKGYRSSPEHAILNEEELERIFSYSGKPMLENVRDLIKVQYHMCMRYDELKSELEKGVDKLPIVKTDKGYRWTILQGKVSERKGVPVHRDIMEMIHENRFPHIISNQKYNNYVKDLCSAVGIQKDLSIASHTIRRSFCTNKFNQGHSFTEIMHYSGHKTENKLRIYIRTENMDLSNSISTGYE